VAPWSRYINGVDEFFEQIRQEVRDAGGDDDAPAAGQSPQDDSVDALGVLFPRVRRSNHLSYLGERLTIGAALAESSTPRSDSPPAPISWQRMDSPVLAPAGLTPQIEPLLNARGAAPPVAKVSAWIPLAIAGSWVVRASPSSKPGRDRLLKIDGTREGTPDQEESRSGEDEDGLPP
jgi:hypothetical protein